MKRIVVIIFIFFGLKTYSCSCISEFSEFTPYYLTEYSRVLVCKPIFLDTVGEYIKYKAVVLKTYLGLKQDTINILTPHINGMCGLPLDLNDTYLIYGTGDSIIYINHCGPSRKLIGKKTSFLDDGNEFDSLSVNINGIYKRYSYPFIRDYFAKTGRLELESLKSITTTMNGKIITKFSNNVSSAEINIKDGKFNGPSKFYFPNGKLKSSGSFINNSMEGIWSEFVFKDKRGKIFYISWTGKYLNNKQRGKWKGKMIIGSFKEFSSYWGYNLNNDYE